MARFYACRIFQENKVDLLLHVCVAGYHLPPIIKCTLFNKSQTSETGLNELYIFDYSPATLHAPYGALDKVQIQHCYVD